jgi:hypothetical protein
MATATVNRWARPALESGPILGFVAAYLVVSNTYGEKGVERERTATRRRRPGEGPSRKGFCFKGL